MNASGQLLANTTSTYTHTGFDTDDAIFTTTAIYYTASVKFTINSVSATGNVVITTNSGTATLVEGAAWTASVDAATTATSLAAAINGLVGLSAVAVNSVVTVTLNTATRISVASTSNAGLTLTSDIGKHWLLGAKKSDPTTWTVICKLGFGSGTHLIESYILDRGLTRLPAGEYLFGEYVTGSAEGTQCRIMSVSSDFATVTELVKFNPTGTAEHIKHIHVVAYDAYSGKVWVSTGDGDTQAATFYVDDILNVAWPTGTNLEPANLINQTGFHGFAGQQRYRSVDIIFTKDWVILGADQSTAGENGIWRFTRDLSIFERVFTDMPTGQNCWTGIKGTEGQVIFITQRTGVGSTDDFLSIIASDGVDYSTWKTIGYVQMRDNRTSSIAKPSAFFAINDDIVCWIEYTAGVNTTRTFCARFGGIFDYNYNLPDPVYPAYFVGTGGADNVTLTGTDYTGLSPRQPFATLSYALSGGHCVHGSLIKVGTATLSEAAIVINLDGFTTSNYGTTDVSQGKPVTLIRGNGAANTIIGNSGANTGLLKNGLVNQVIGFQDITVTNGATNQNILWSSNTIITTWILGRGCKISAPGNASLTRGIYVRDDIVIMEPGSLLEGPSSSAAVGISATTDNTTQYDIRPGAVIKGFRHSLLFGFATGPTGTCSLKVEGATLIGFSQSSATYGAISINAGATSGMILGIKNTVAKSNTGVAPIVTGGAGATWTDSLLDYCATDVAPAMAGTYNTHGKAALDWLLSADGVPSVLSPLLQSGNGLYSYGALDNVGARYHRLDNIPGYNRNQTIGAFEINATDAFSVADRSAEMRGQLSYSARYGIIVNC